MYKVVAKLLANRMRDVMPYLIDDCQFAFVGGRNILDNILIANEVVHEARRRKKPTFALKVDYEKAYDSVRWDFLLYMLRRLNFGEKWLRWVRRCLESATVSVLVNGSPSSEFTMEKGLRQGDPLAPFLFIIVTEGLSGLMRQVVQLGKFNPFSFLLSPDSSVSLIQF